MPPSLRLHVYAVCGKVRNKVEQPRDRGTTDGSDEHRPCRPRHPRPRPRRRRRRRRDARFYRAASLRARRTNSRGRTVRRGRSLKRNIEK